MQEKNLMNGDNMDNETKHCDSCGQKIKKLNPHSMDLSKVKLLLKIFHMNEKGIEWVKIQQDSALIKADEIESTIQCDAVHASRLKWFNLVELKGTRTGEYKINPNGRGFLRGHWHVPKKIFCINGHVVKWSDEMVNVNDVKGIVLDKEYWDNYADLQENF